MLSDGDRLSRRAVFVSVVSIWEILLKHHSGKLRADQDIDLVVDSIERQPDWFLLGLETRHLRTLSSLARFEDHKDPSDRLLIAQAIHERLDIVTADAQFCRYDVTVVW